MEISDLTSRGQSIDVELGISQPGGVSKENMTRQTAETANHFQDACTGQGSSNNGTIQRQSDEAGFSDRGSSPSAPGELGKPRAGAIVVNVLWPGQRDQNVDIEQGRLIGRRRLWLSRRPDAGSPPRA
jgi:hypothetical protein